MPVTDIGLRERKKADTRRAIAEVALELALERGPDDVTVDDIAAAADVSPRTVFNHFGTKDEAMLGIDPERRAELAAELAARPEKEPPIEALQIVLADAMTTSEGAVNLWLARARLVAEHPRLRSAQIASQNALEHEMAAVIADRVGLDPDVDLYPRLVVAAAFATLRTVVSSAATASRRRLRNEIDAAFTMLAEGLPAPRRTR